MTFKFLLHSRIQQFGELQIFLPDPNIRQEAGRDASLAASEASDALRPATRPQGPPDVKFRIYIDKRPVFVP